jgi:hypothetical protein
MQGLAKARREQAIKRIYGGKATASVVAITFRIGSGVSGQPFGGPEELGKALANCEVGD